jgi:molybdopterin/thiamine biosynthesis adenylyltransferase
MSEFTDSPTEARYVTEVLDLTHPAEVPVHDRSRRVPGYRHTALRESSATLIGAGGLNGEIGHSLSRKAIGTLEIFDPDFVELSNLNRQRFFRPDLYTNKACALAKNLAREATGRSTIIGYPLRFQEALRKGIDVSCTVAVCGVDNDETRVDVSRHYRARRTPVVFIAVSRDAANGYVFVQEGSSDSACFGCLFPDAVDNPATSPCDDPAGATIDVLKAVAGIATYAIDSLIMPRRRTWNYKEVFLAGQLRDGHRVIPKREDCPLCGS